MSESEKLKIDGQDYFSPNQREEIYDKDLMPLKAKISQILIYDSEMALQFLQEYENIIKNGENLGIDILNRIVKLELEIEQYENEHGKKKVSNEQVETIVKMVDDLLVREEEIETEELEQEYLKVKEIYENINKEVSYSGKDIIEPKIFLLQAQVLIRKAREGAIDLYNDISEEDIAGLTLIINAKINELMQNPSQEIQDKINKIKLEMINRTDFVYDPKIWSMLDTQAPKQRLSTNLQVVTPKAQRVEALVPVKTKNIGFQFPSVGRSSLKKIKVGCQSMYVRNTVELGNQVVRVKDLAKINIEWLAAHMPEKMLEEFEELKLGQEDRKINGKKYVPDAKVPIFDYIESEIPEIKGFIFTNEEGIKLRARDFDYDHENNIKPYIKIEALDGNCITDERINWYCRPIKDSGELLHYANFIDRVIGGNLEQQLKDELGVFLEKAVKSNNQLELRWI